MANKLINLTIRGEISDTDAVSSVIDAINEAEPKRTWWGFFWELDFKYKLIIIALVAYVTYAAYLWYVTGNYYAIIDFSRPLVDLLIDAVKGMFIGE